MNAIPKHHMTVDQYFAWAERRPGRFELLDGAVYEMSPETAGHAKTKAAIYVALMTAIRRQRSRCHVLPDGMTIRVGEMTAYEPDAIIYCGVELDAAAVEVPHPVTVADVLSPSARHVDLAAKLAGYLRVPSIVHYLIVDPAQPLIIHHARQAGDAFLAPGVREGAIALDPPGMEISIADVYGEQAD
ncbi:MAG TPA: Uma2 family endonuclease [Xanthobacteraceae bacterium]|nr:Uma2 family endonuclease [Xanthobacteraceae bacterium]